MTPLFRWPAAARVDRELTKERLYKEGAVSAAVRRRFIEEVQQVRWAYKLGAESIRLPGDDALSEFQVFEVDLKGDELSDSVLVSIDKAVPSPIIFEVRRAHAGRREAQPVAAPKRQGPRGATVGDYLRGAWTVEPSDRVPLPPAIDLLGLYEQLLFTLLPIAARRGEDLTAALERAGRVRKLRHEIELLDKRIRREPQFNRKVALRAELRAHQAELDALLSPTDTTSENPACKS